MYISCEVSYLHFAGLSVTTACALFMPTSVPAQGAMLKVERTRTVAFPNGGHLSNGTSLAEQRLADLVLVRVPTNLLPQSYKRISRAFYPPPSCEYS